MSHSGNVARSISDKLLAKFNTGTVISLKSFFSGRWYPLAVAAMILLGHTLCIEIFLLPMLTLLFLAAMLVSDSIRPMIIVLCTFLYQVPLDHTPGGPAWSQYYSGGAVLTVMVVCATVILLTLVYTAVKLEVFSGLSLTKTPLLFSMAALGVSFLLGGAFSKTWQPADLLWGALQAVLFPLLFLVFYKGLKNENLSDLANYLAYVSAIIGVLLFLEIADLYVFGNAVYGTVIDETGAVIKDRIHLGWATWNPVGVAIAVNIPMIFYGVMKGRYPVLYFLSAVLTYAASILTFSRNAMIAGTLAFAACVLISCFAGERRRRLVMRTVTVVGAACMIVVAAVLFDKIYVFARDIFERGLSDNGRFNVWLTAFDNFRSAPVFGSGYYHFNSPELYNYSPAIPLMAHQTFLQLLSSMGVVGLVAYLYYRFDTAEIFFVRPTLMKTMMGLSILVLLFESMLDNFIFTIFPLFYYSILLAVCALVYEKQKAQGIEQPSAENGAGNTEWQA